MAARRSFERLREELDQIVDWLWLVRSDGVPDDLDGAAAVEKAAKEYDRALRLVVELEGKVDDATARERGGAGLDLDAARAEIGRRLDLRAAAR
jgi:exonuclease VII small subunit